MLTGVETQRRRRDGTIIDVSLSTAAIRDADGEIIGAMGVLKDITERKERESELRRNERRFEALLQDPNILAGLLETDGTVIDANQTSMEYIAADRAEVIGKRFWETPWWEGHDESQAIIQEKVTQAAAGEYVSYEADLTDEDGDPFSVTGTIRPVRDANGTVVSLVVSARDITERREQERALERTAQMLEQSQRLASIGAWRLDVTGGHVDAMIWTDEVYRIYGLPVGEEVELDAGIDFYHPEDRPTIRHAVVRAIHYNDSYDLEARLHTADGNLRWVRTIGEPVVENGVVTAVRGSIQDITERKEREQALERTKDLLDQTETLATVGGWEIPAGDDPADGIQTSGLQRILDLPSEGLVSFEQLLEFIHPGDRAQVTREVRRLVENDEPFDVTARIVTAADDSRWVRAIGVPVENDGTVVAYRGAMVDITERKEYEQALVSLHELERELLGTDSEQAVGELVVTTVADVLGTPAVGIYQLDTDRNELTSVAVTDGFTERCGGTPSVAVGTSDSPLWTAFATQEQTVCEAVDTEAAPVFGAWANGGLVVPLGEHGVFVLLIDPSTLGRDFRRIVETLAATTEAAFDRLGSKADLQERDAELQTQNERLERQLRINSIIRSVDQSLIDAGNRTEIEAVVCERLVESSDLSFAWIGHAHPAGTHLEPRAWAGSHDGYLDSIDLGHASSEPSCLASESDTVTAIPNVVAALQDGSWATEALARNFNSVVSVPLSFDGYTYGILSVYAEEQGTFSEREQSVFAELGENIGHSINAAQTRRALSGETAIELELTVDSEETILGRLANVGDCRVEFEGIATDDEDGTRLFFRTVGVDAAAIESALREVVSVQGYTLVSDTADGCLFEATVSGAVLAAKLTQYGGRITGMYCESDETIVSVALPRMTDVRELLNALSAQYPSVELATRRDIDQEATPTVQRMATILDTLTERQREVLQTAFFAGFFETPRTTSADGIAEMLSVSQPTVSRHLRRAQQRLLTQLFDPETGSV